jgi:kumamolisin
VATAQVMGAAPAAAVQSSIVFLRPRNPGLLKRTATAASAGHALTTPEIKRLFLPTRSQIGQVEDYLRSQGLTVTGQHLLTLTVTGTTAEQESAFGVDLKRYRSRTGEAFRAPDSSPRLPTSIAPLVAAVGGLDTSMTMHRSGSGSAVRPATVTPTCSGAQGAHSAYSGTLLPAQLGSSGGYNHTALINAGDNGSNEAIAFVEFSNYKPADLTTYRHCFPAITSPAAVRKSVAGGTSVMSGAGEVELDVETAMAAAPDAATYVYVAPNNVANGIAMINQMVADQGSTNVHIVSDSWGLCEPATSASIMGAENTALQLAAAAGMSFYVASGDQGSSACVNSTGSTALATVDPASQPYATAVGGTRLRTSPRSEVTWRDGGGGSSIFFPKPAWQVGHTLTVANAGSKCGNPGGQCRQLPDVALNASENSAYIIYCTVNSSACGGLTGWLPVAGTSGSAPLMAGITADVNEYSLAHGGPRLGFANPFLYAPTTISSGSFHDITKGSNSITGGSQFTARKGYDMATGLGSVNAVALAQTLAQNGRPSTPSPHTSKLTVATPLPNKSFVYGKRITFSGKLTDTTGSKPIGGGLITVQLSTGHLRAVSKPNGTWSVTVTKRVKQNIRWRAAYAGSAAHRAAPVTSYRNLRIIPHLSTASSLARSGSGYHGWANTYFTFHGVSKPNMHRARVVVQSRRASGGPWHTVFKSTVGKKGDYSITIRHAKPGSVYLRWFYSGSGGQRWMSAGSPRRLFHFS